MLTVDQEACKGLVMLLVLLEHAYHLHTVLCFISPLLLVCGPTENLYCTKEFTRQSELLTYNKEIIKILKANHDCVWAYFRYDGTAVYAHVLCHVISLNGS